MKRNDIVKYSLYATTDGTHRITLRFGKWLPRGKNRVILANSTMTGAEYAIIKERRFIDLFFQNGTNVFSLTPPAYGENWTYGGAHNPRHENLCLLWNKGKSVFVGYDNK